MAEINEADIPTSELMAYRAEQHLVLRDLKAEVEKVETVLEGLDSILLDRLPEGIDSMAHTTENGTKITLKRKVTERFQPAAGQSDRFWQWAQENQQWSMYSRTVMQSGVKNYIATMGGLPPGIEVASKTTAGVTVTVGAPRA